MAIDPLDNPYIDNIQFYGNHKVMPGINFASSYNLQMMIQSIFLSNRTKLSDEKNRYISILLNDNLMVSTDVCKNVRFQTNYHHSLAKYLFLIKLSLKVI